MLLWKQGIDLIVYAEPHVLYTGHLSGEMANEGP